MIEMELMQQTGMAPMQILIAATKNGAFASARLLVVCLPVMAAISPTYAQPLQAGTDFSAVVAYVEAQMKTLKIPGLALAIVQEDQVIYLKGHGQAHPDGSPVTSQTPFMIGSTTKSITALAVYAISGIWQNRAGRSCADIHPLVPRGG